MPEYLAPGVYVEETSFRHKSIEGVSTSVGGLVGPTRTGPTRGLPVLCTSNADFEAIFGDAGDLAFAGEQDAPAWQTVNATAYGARAFFENGGKQLYVKRVVAGANDDDAGQGSGAFATRTAIANGAGVTLRARFVGNAGNVFVGFRPSLQRGVVTFTDVAEPAAATVYAIRVRALAAAAITGRPANNAQPAADRFPLTVMALAQRNAADDGWALEDRPIAFVDAAGNAGTATRAQFGTGIADAAANVDTDVTARELQATAPLAAGELLALDLTGVTGADPLHAALGLSAEPPRVPWFGGIDGAVAAGRIAGNATVTFQRAANGLAAGNAITVPLLLLAGVGRPGSVAVGPARFDIDVMRASGPANAARPGETLLSVGDVSLDATSARAANRLLPATPTREAEFLTQPIAVTQLLGAPQAAFVQLATAFDAAARAAAGPGEEPRLLVRLQGGTDGARPEAGDYAGEVDESNGSTGLAALEAIEDVSIVMTPAAPQSGDDTAHEQIVLAVQAHCRRMRFRVGVVDSPHDASVQGVLAFRNQFSDDRLAIYYPWIETASVTPGRTGSVIVPPGGHVGGVYAGTDVSRGVHKAPANEVVIGASGLEKYVNTFQQEVLNPQRVNCIRFFPGRGIRVWGARTMGQDPEWMYVNVRRYFLYLERSIQKSTDWVVFEPNGEDLWANVRATVEDFLYNEFANRRLLGSSPEEAFFVRCDRSTMTQNDLDNGRLICLVGVAPLRPAEFVVFRIGQKTADSK